MGTAYATPSTSIGLAIEATRGTAAAPTYWEKTKAPKYKPNLTLLPDDTLQGSMVKTYDLVPGLRYDGHGWDGHLYGDTFAVLACCELGSTDNLIVAPANTTLAAAASPGDTTISTVASVAAGSWITLVGTAGIVETHKVVSVSGAGPFTLTLTFPIHYAQASGAAVTGLTGHRFSLLNNAGASGNQPPSLSICDFSGEEWRQITAAQIDKLTIKANANALIDYSADFFGNPSIPPSPTPTASFTGTDPIPAWAGDVAIGGTHVNYIEEIEYDFARGVKPIPALTGTTAYFQYFADALTAAGKMTAIEQSGSPILTQFQNYTQQSLDYTTFDVRSGFAVRIYSSKAEWKTGELDRGKSWISVPAEFDLLPTTTDALAGGKSPVIIEVANLTATAYH